MGLTSLKTPPILKICTLIPWIVLSLNAASTNWFSFSMDDPSFRMNMHLE